MFNSTLRRAVCEVWQKNAVQVIAIDMDLSGLGGFCLEVGRFFLYKKT